jgi:hypothetical protein
MSSEDAAGLYRKDFRREAVPVTKASARGRP